MSENSDAFSCVKSEMCFNRPLPTDLPVFCRKLINDSEILGNKVSSGVGNLDEGENGFFQDDFFSHFF